MEKFIFENREFFKVSVEMLRSDSVINFPLYVHMQKNETLVLRYSVPSTPQKDDLQKYRSRGLKFFVCPVEHYPEWLRYLENIQSPSLLPEMAKVESDVPLSPEERKKVLNDVGRKMLYTMTTINTGSMEEKWDALRECQSAANRIVELGLQTHNAKNIYEELANMTNNDMEHTSCVATIAVVFALISGISEYGELVEISMGGLLHDIGLSFVTPEVVGKSFSELNEKEFKMIKEHPMEGAQLLETFGDELSLLVKKIVLQHHERADGRGFPKRLRHPQIEPQVQTVVLADVIADYMRGRLTGKEMNPQEAFELMKRRQTTLDEQMVTPQFLETVHQAVIDSHSFYKKMSA